MGIRFVETLYVHPLTFRGLKEILPIRFVQIEVDEVFPVGQVLGQTDMPINGEFTWLDVVESAGVATRDITC